MKKSKLLVVSAVLIVALALVAGCGGGADKGKEPAKTAQHSMPAGDPMPMMKDMGQQVQDMSRHLKAGQMMDAQRLATQVASTADKVTPHMTDAALKEKMQKAAYDLRDTMNGAKIDQTVVEAKLKTMQEVMQQATGHLQSVSHTKH
jgi:cytochrome c556